MSPDQMEPQRLPALVEAFAQTAGAILGLARGCSADDLAQPTDCPGWTVHDQIAHVAGVESLLDGRKDPRIELPPYEHIKNEVGRRVEYAVQVRRGRTGAELVAELEDVLAERLAMLRGPAMTDSTIIAGPFGPDQATTVLLYRIFDVWTHEQDIRVALGRPGDLDSRSARVCVDSVLTLLPKVVAKGAGLDPGHPVVLEVTGPVTAREGVLVELDDQGRARGRAISGPERTGQALAHPATTISLSTEALMRRAAGRRPVSETEYHVEGDDAVARRVLEALVLTP